MEQKYKVEQIFTKNYARLKVFTWQRQSLRRFFYLQQQRWRYGQN